MSKSKKNCKEKESLIEVHDINLNKEQKETLKKLIHWWKHERLHKQTFEISGAAGTGKTTLIRYLIKKIGLSDDQVRFMAYVGKATLAMKMNGIQATTIHKVITTFHKEKVMEGDHQLVIDGHPQWKSVFYPREYLDECIRLIVVDEGSMVPEYMAKWLLRYNIPIIVLGDLNQLPPVRGNAYFLRKPDAILTQIMRQAKDSPIPYVAQHARLGDESIFSKPGEIEDKVIIKSIDDLTDDEMVEADIILCPTNKERDHANRYIRESVLGMTAPYPIIGDKMICRENNWNESINDDIFLINGMVGYVEDIDLESITEYKMRIDFRPEFLENEAYRNLEIDRTYMRLSPEHKLKYNSNYNKFEYAYAITCHLAQGSQYNHVIVNMSRLWNLKSLQNRQWLYTAITRAVNKLTIVY